MRKTSGGITGGIIMIGIAVLLVTDYWWPGIMFVIGAALAIPALLRKEYSKAGLAVVIFAGIPFVVTAMVNITYVAAAVLAIVGLYNIIRRS